MTQTTSEELRFLAEELDRAANFLTPERDAVIERIRKVVTNLDSVWSGSQFGYQANVYHLDFETQSTVNTSALNGDFKFLLLAVQKVNGKNTDSKIF